MAPPDDEEISKMKMKRRQYKSAVTKKINKIEQHLAEDDKPNLAKETEALKKVFIDFEDIHNRVYSMTEDLDQQDVEDKYFFDVRDGYIKAHLLLPLSRLLGSLWMMMGPNYSTYSSSLRVRHYRRYNSVPCTGGLGMNI